jgi:hypothetical protein
VLEREKSVEKRGFHCCLSDSLQNLVERGCWNGVVCATINMRPTSVLYIESRKSREEDKMEDVFTAGRQRMKMEMSNTMVLVHSTRKGNIGGLAELGGQRGDASWTDHFKK